MIINGGNDASVIYVYGKNKYVKKRNARSNCLYMSDIYYIYTAVILSVNLSTYFITDRYGAIYFLLLNNILLI